MTKARDLANASTALSAVSATELAFVDGVTSAIQTQIDAKAPSSTAVTLTGTETLTNKTLTSPALTTPTISTLTTNGDLLYGTGSGAIVRRAIGSTGNVLTVAGGIPTWAAPAGGGKVLQVVQAVTQTTTTISSSNAVDSSITASITPSSATSKVLVLVSGNTRLTRSAGGSRQTRFHSNICRNGTAVFDDSSGQTFGVQLSAVTSGSVEHFTRVALTYLDSPATTSATTYKVQYIGSTDWTLEAQHGSGMSSIILLEIGA
jgi:hypothetical protein